MDEQLLGKRDWKAPRPPRASISFIQRQLAVEMSLWQLTQQLASNMIAYSTKSLWQLTPGIAFNIIAYSRRSLQRTALLGHISFQKKELEAAYAEDPMRVSQLQLQRCFRKNLWQLMLQETWLNIANSSTRASQQQLIQSKSSGGERVASALALSSTSPKHSTRTSRSFKLTSLLSIFLFILMVSSLTFTSLSFHTTSFLQWLGF